MVTFNFVKWPKTYICQEIPHSVKIGSLQKGACRVPAIKRPEQKIQDTLVDGYVTITIYLQIS